MKADVFNARALREAFGAFPTAVTVITANDPADRPVGSTANSFASVSLDPPLLLVCLAKTSRDYPTMTKAEHFAINILSEAQKNVSINFARPAEDRFAAVDWARGPNGCPIFAQVAAWFECSMHDVIEAGDHVMMVGRVTAFESTGLNGLGYARGGYFTPRVPAKAVSSAAGGEICAAAVLERHGSLFPLGDENLPFPSCSAAGGDPANTLASHLEQLGLSVHDWFSLLDL
ncbi:flavin reductase family protein [Rhizobium mongolense]|uniref:Flavin reductase (DIM6/NTAB) family NADH-FMN oxidoreductase RutF n=2 Tax=Rhizobium mongolense TaxID=57676 RepID=A0ABR6IZ18_9HYPH|nr:flavin reductase family protein [Rhizobium mongolense]MBB4233166.1 flavin reductase (DIM6/NTAB) family NADH-FMN oxidoreductase RutF [Rhizobium mongolense]TVZ75276.1 flavin reductase (DIM6/NTAB) family NADH-FMN oxidoreductase RutF [Rhizobium mongolense USDA 1844]